MQSKSQSAAAAAMAHYGDALKAMVADKELAGNTKLQNLICLGIPVYNTFAALEGWPQIPLPAFCTSAK